MWWAGKVSQKGFVVEERIPFAGAILLCRESTVVEWATWIVRARDDGTA